MEDHHVRYGQQQSGWSSDYPPPHHPPRSPSQQNPLTGHQQPYMSHRQAPPPQGPPPYTHGPPPYGQGAPPYTTGLDPPPHGHGPPSHSYGPRPPQHRQYSQSYRPYTDSNGSHIHGYGQPPQEQGPPLHVHDPQVNERQPMPGYGHGIHGPPPNVHNQETHPEMEHHRTFHGYGHNQVCAPNIHSDLPYRNVTSKDEQTKPSTDQSAEQEWVNSWITKNKINHRLKRKKQQESSLTVPDARRLMREALSVTEDLQRVETDLCEKLNDKDGKWEQLIEKVKLLKERLSEIKELMSTAVLEQVVTRMSQIKNKRLRLKANRKRSYKEEQKKLKRREELHQSIDAWRARILKKDEDKKKEKELKAAADVTLAEVRRKLHEAEKSRDLLMALSKLRQLRKDAAERKGVSFSMGLDKDFEERTEEQLRMLREQLSVYDAEKMTLEAMLEMEAEETREREIEERKQKIEELERRKERTIKRILFGREIHLEEDDQMLPFRQYYGQADLSIENLIQIRHEWDLFLVPPMSGGSRLPEGWVMPAEPSSDAWASVLKDRLTVT